MSYSFLYPTSSSASCTWSMSNNAFMEETVAGGGKRRKRASRKRGSSQATKRLSKIRTEKCPRAVTISRPLVTIGRAVYGGWKPDYCELRSKWQVKMVAVSVHYSFVKLGYEGKKQMASAP